MVRRKEKPFERDKLSKDTEVLKRAQNLFFFMSYFSGFIHKNVKQKLELTWNLWYNIFI